MSKRKAKIVHLLAFIALVANLFAPVFTLPVLAEDLAPSDPVVTTSNEADEAEQQRLAEEEAERQRQAEADAAATKAAEDAAATKAAEDAAATKAAEDEAARQQAEQERLAEEERLKQEEERLEAERLAEEEAAQKKAEEEAAEKKAAEEEAARQQAEADEAKKQAEEDEANGDDGVEGNNIQGSSVQSLGEPETLPVVPSVQLVDATCPADGFTQTVQTPDATSGVNYHVDVTDEGAVTVTATLGEGSSWDTEAIGNDWQLQGEAYIFTTNLEPCETAMSLLSVESLPGNATFSGKTIASGDWVPSLAANGMNPVCGETVQFLLVFTPKSSGSYDIWVEFDKAANNGDPYGYVNAQWTALTAEPAGTFATGPSLVSSFDSGSAWRAQATFTTSDTVGQITGLLTAKIECDVNAKLNSNVHARKQSSQATIPAQVLSGTTNDECRLENGKPKDCETAQLPSLVILENATCTDGQDQPSKITLTEGSGFDVALVKDVTNDIDYTDGFGEYTFNNTKDMKVRVELTLQEGYAYQVQTQGNPWLPEGDWPGNNQWVLGGTGATKYQEIDLAYTPCPEPEVTIEKVPVYPPGYKNGVEWKITVKNHGDTKQRVQIIETSPDGEWTWELHGNYCDKHGVNVDGQRQWKCDVDVPAQKNGAPGVQTFTFASEMAKDCGSYDNTVTLQVGKWGYGWDWTTVGSASSTFEKDCPAPDLSIEKELEKPRKGTAKPGDTIEFKVTVKNHGPADADGVTFTDTMSPELLDLTWDLPNGCSWQDSSILCSTDTIKDGKSWTGTFSAKVPADGSVCGEFTNTAQLSTGESYGDNGIQTAGSNKDPKPRQTEDSASVTIECDPGIKIDKSASKDEVELGDTFTYTIKVTNTGNTNLNGYVVTDQLDTNYLSFQSLEGDLCSEPTPGSGLVTCAVTDLTPKGQPGNASQTFEITVQVRDDLGPEMCGTSIENVASVGLPDVQISGGGGDNSGPVEATSKTVKTWLKDCDPELSIEKERTSSQTAEPGDTIEFKVTVKNTGSGNASDVYFTDTMDATLAELGWTVDDACELQDDDSYLCGPFDLDAEDGKKEFTFSAEVPPDGSVCSDKWLTNTATIVEGSDNNQPEFSTSGNKGGETTSSASVKINCDPDIKIEKSDQLGKNGSVSPGDQFTYKITVSNTGNTELSGYVMTDELPINLVDFVGFVGQGSQNACEINDGVVTCSVKDLQPGKNSSQTFYIKVEVKTSLDTWQCDEIVNHASVAIGESQPILTSASHGGGNNNGDVSDETYETTSFSKKACTPNIDISKTDNVGKGESVEPGGSFTYTITVTNDGDIDASNYSMADTLRDYLTFNFANGGPEDCTVNGQDIECDLPDLAPGESWSIEVPVTLTDSPSSYVCKYGAYNQADVEVAQMVIPQSISTSSHGGGKSGTSDSDDERTLVNCDPSIDITKDVDPSNAEPGDDINYTITIENNGNLDLRNVVLADPLILLPVEGWSYTAPEGITCGFVLESFGCDIGSMEVDAIIEITLSGTITTAPVFLTCLFGFTNYAGVVANSNGGAVAESDGAKTRLDCDPSMTFTKTAVNGTVEPGGTMAFEIVFTNTGNIDVTNATITDPLPALPDGDEWEVTTAGASESLASFPYDVELLEPGDSVTLVARAQVPATLELTENGNEWCKLWENTASVSGRYSNSSRIKGSDSAEVQVNCTGVSIEKSVSDEIVEPGDSLTYTILVTNMGNTPVNGIHVDDSLDPRLSIITASFNGTDCDVVGNNIDCFIGTLPVGGSAEITITADVIAEPTTMQCDDGDIENRAQLSLFTPRSLQSITIPQEFPIDSNRVETEFNCTPDLEIEKTVADASVAPEDTLEFSITVTNTGTYPATDLSLLDDLSLAGVDGLEWTDNSDACEIVGGVLNCEIDEVPAYTGNEFTVTFSAEVQADDPVCGPYTNTVTLGGDDARYAANPVSEVDFVIDCAPDYDVVKTSGDADENGELSVGDTITYTITVTNTGNQDLSGIILDDQFSGAGEDGLTWTAPDGFDGENVPDIAVGGNIDLVATYVITQADVDAGEIENCAFMTYPVNGEAIERDDCADDEIDQDPVYTVAKTSALTNDVDENDALSVGDTITYTITVTNTGTVTLGGITLDDQFSGSGELTWTTPEGFDGVNVPDINVGNSVDLVATYVITQADVDAGEIENCALMTYPVDEEAVIERDDCEDDDIPQNPDVDLLKTGTVSGGADVLELDNTITYTFTVTNSGNVTIENLEIDDPMEGVEFTDGNTIATLAPGESVELEAQYSVVQMDVNVGMIVNCADVEGIAADGSEVTDSNCDTKLVDQERDLDVFVAHECPAPAEELLAEGNFEITYELTVVNDGTVTVRDVVFTTSHEGVFDEPFPTTFEPGQSETRNWTITATEEEFESRVIDVEVTVIGKTDNGATAMLASMAATQVLDDEVESRLVLTCPIDVPVDPEPEPDPVIDPDSTSQPKPESLDKQAQAVAVSSLPVTGSGNVASTAAMLWAAAMLSVVALGATAVGIRVKHRR